jgi:2-dehydropantoate 2-reductase
VTMEANDVRYVIAGAGAVGGTIGARLFQSGHDVVLLARGPHLDALRAGGLRLMTPAASLTLPIPAIAQPAEVDLRAGDVLVLAVKTQDAAALLADWAGQPMSGGTAAESLPVVCALNGVASERIALRRFRSVYGMCVWLPATHLEPGTVEAQGAPMSGMLHIGRYPSGADAVAEQIGADLARSHFLAPVSADVMRWKYGKLLSNLGNAIEALCGRGGGDDAADLGRRVRAEGTAVLDAAGIGYASRAEEATTRGDQVQAWPVNGSVRSGGSSWQSLARGTGSIEADFLNGEIVLLGREHGVPTPLNEVLQRLANQAAREGSAPGSMTPRQVLAAIALLPAGRSSRATGMRRSAGNRNRMTSLEGSGLRCSDYAAQAERPMSVSDRDSPCCAVPTGTCGARCDGPLAVGARERVVPELGWPAA